MSYAINMTSDDVMVMKRGDFIPVNAGPALRASKWRGGTFVKFSDNQDPSVAERTVEVSDGVIAVGFLVNPSENYANHRQSNPYNYTSFQPGNVFSSPSGTSVVTMAMIGGSMYTFRVYETEALGPGGTRDGGPISYSMNDTVYVSENGIICNDDPTYIMAATGGSSVVEVGFVHKVPTSDDPRLGVLIP